MRLSTYVMDCVVRGKEVFALLKDSFGGKKHSVFIELSIHFVKLFQKSKIILWHNPKGKNMKQIKKFLEKAEKIAQLQQKKWEPQRFLAAEIPAVFVLPYAEFEQKYGSNLYLNSDFDVLVFDGNLSLSQSTLNSWWLIEQFEQAGSDNDRRAMFVNGNLLIDGDIIDDNYLFLQVAKDTVCHYLHSENGNIVIGCSLTAQQGISGEYNDGMLQVLGKTQAPYIVSNDHSMPDNSVAECVYIQDGQIGCSYHGTLEGWEFFENSELMFKESIYEGDYQINISAFFELIKNGENPLVDFETFEANKAAWDEEQDEDESDLDKEDEPQSIAEILYLENFSGSDEALYEYIVDEYQAIEKIGDESEKYAYGGRVFELFIIAARMVENWRLITDRYSTEKVDALRKIIIKSSTYLAKYFLKIGDKKQLLFVYQFLNDDVVGIEKDEPYLYETLVRIGLELEDYDSTYELVSVIDKKSEFLPEEVVKSIADVINSEGYRAWLAKR